MLWMLWITISVTGALFALAAIIYGGNRSFLLIGRTTDGHHQIELACDACHTSVFGGPDTIQAACVKCHGAALKLSNDSHPLSKFTDPRNADRIEGLDARYCVTCHREHRPAITRAMGVTLPDDHCYHCHHDIAKDRPSHAGLKFDTCASAGCHNFHDNRALYTEFLVKHAEEPDQLATQRVALINFLANKDKAIKIPRALVASDTDAPPDQANPKVIIDWAADLHARAAVNCSGCHATKAAPDRWIAAPAIETCKSCHANQAATFTEGRHGMRLREGLFATREDPFGLFKASRLPPMSPKEARLPMKADAADKTLTCNTCHSAHKYDLVAAQVTACAGCHDDPHTKAYFASPHYDLFKKEIAGQLPRGSGVSCATCHMPIVERRDEYGEKSIFVTHNQNDNLRPNEKMVRSVCGDCHGQRFTLDALADSALIARNFKGLPGVHIESIEWAKKRVKERGETRK
jgi:Cytochrome c3